MDQPPAASPRVPVGKTAVPELPPEFTPRRPLHRLLDGAAPGQVIVVSAPAGFGKTLMLADWVRGSAEPETAWVSLETDDDDPRRLWPAVVGALLALPSTGADPRLRALGDSLGAPRQGDVVEELADVLDDLCRPVRIVLDDIHVLSGHEVLDGLGRLVRRRPSQLELVVAGRSDPPISIARLRLEGRLHEVRAAALRFTPAEPATLLAASGLDLSPRQVAELHARTGGWAAGLRLAALALRRTDDPVGLIAHFSGDERSVADYLSGEILDGLGRDTRQFLRAVSVCSPVPSALAAALSGDAAAEAGLDRLRSGTGLVERTPRGSYRIHPLLRTHLVAEAARHSPAAHRDLQSVAARWWAAQGDPAHALSHAGRAGDRALTTALLRRSGVSLLLAGDQGALRRALTAVGPDARSADPWLALTAALSHIDRRAFAPAAAEIADARTAWPEAPDPALTALRDSAELLAGAVGIGRIPSPRPPSEPTGVAPEMAALLHLSRGVAEFADPSGPDVPLARGQLERARRLARAHGLGYLEVQALELLSTLAGLDGDRRGMVRAAREAALTATRIGRNPSAWSAGAEGVLAQAELLAGDPEAAAARVEAALGSREALPPEAAFVLRGVHGAAVADLGRLADGFGEMRAARAAFADGAATAPVLAGQALLEHRLALLNGSLASAEEVAGWLSARVGATGETLLLTAWAELAVGRPEAAAGVVAPVLRDATPCLLPETAVEAHLLDAEAALQRGDLPAGRSALEVALEAAEPLGLLRPFALAGPRTQELVRTRAAGARRDSFAGRLATSRAVAAPVLLSEREQAVLALLPSLLNAREIADEFTVSVNTVKSHIRAIYAKLGVSSRREAVLVARERRLLP